MKKAVITLCLLCLGAVAYAQNDGTEERRYGLFDRKKQKQAADKEAANKAIYGDKATGERPRRGLFESHRKDPVDEKYLAGACPEVNGRIQWDKTISVPGKSAQQIFDQMHTFLKGFVKEKEMTDKSKVSLAEEGSKQLAARIQEWIVFERKPLSLDQTKFNYQLLITCKDGSCSVTMRNMSYIYEEERGGGQFPAEDQISDKEALNKAKNGFRLGGCRKFRTKTIDRKDQLFARIEALLNDK